MEVDRAERSIKRKWKKLVEMDITESEVKQGRFFDLLYMKTDLLMVLRTVMIVQSKYV